MFFLKREEQIQIKILVGLLLLIGFLHMFLSPEQIPLKKVVLKGENQLEIDYSTKDNQIKLNDLSQIGKATPNKIYINKSSFEDLLCCPGIGHKIAAQIIEERNHCPFYDWRNFQDRIKGISSLQVDILKDAGVRLNPPVN